MSILVSKGLPLELGKYPPNVKISDMYFTPADDPEFVNNQIYIPAEMAQQQQKKPNKTVLPATSKKVFPWSSHKHKHLLLILFRILNDPTFYLA